jgi:D-3-phosphoglycerate dehydrogenase / 2-oxoglutarate reductase
VELHPISVVNIDSYYRAPRGYAYEERLLRSLGASLTLATAETEDAVIEACREAEIVLIEHPSTPFTRRVIEALDRCWVIARYGIGLDNVDLTAATECGIVVCHAPRFCVEEVSDQTAALLLNVARRVMTVDREVQRGGWRVDFDPPIRRLRTQRLGFLGFGRIAQRVAEKMKPFGLRMAAFDPYVSPELAAGAGVEIVSFEELLRSTDFLSVHAPYTQETHHILGSAEFRQMKSTAWIVNTSRGQLIDEDALVAALSSGTITGAALDVTEIEPLPVGSKLRGMKNVLLTSHHAAVSAESLEELRTTIAASMEAVLKEYWPQYVANPSVTPRRPLAPWNAFAALPDRLVEVVS